MTSLFFNLLITIPASIAKSNTWMVRLSLKNWTHEIETDPLLYLEISPLATTLVFTPEPGSNK